MKWTSDWKSLNKDDFKEVWKQILIIYSPVLLLCLDQIEKWQFNLNVIWALAISLTIDVFRRFITDFVEEAKNTLKSNK